MSSTCVVSTFLFQVQCQWSIWLVLLHLRPYAGAFIWISVWYQDLVSRCSTVHSVICMSIQYTLVAWSMWSVFTDVDHSFWVILNHMVLHICMSHTTWFSINWYSLGVVKLWMTNYTFGIQVAIITCYYCTVSDASWSFPALTGIMSLAFFIHSCVLSIMRNQAKPENNVRLSPTISSVLYRCISVITTTALVLYIVGKRSDRSFYMCHIDLYICGHCFLCILASLQQSMYWWG